MEDKFEKHGITLTKRTSEGNQIIQTAILNKLSKQPACFHESRIISSVFGIEEKEKLAKEIGIAPKARPA